MSSLGGKSTTTTPEIEAQTILDIGIGQQTVESMTKLRQNIADLDDSRA
jgi:hypothetical protein